MYVVSRAELNHTADSAPQSKERSTSKYGYSRRRGYASGNPNL